MNYKAIIFDLDGTIIDTNPIWEQANKKLLLQHGRELTPDIIEKLCSDSHGLALDKSCQLIKEIGQLECPLDDLICQKAALAKEFYHKGIRFIDGFKEFHDKVEAYGLKHAIATNADEGTLEITKRVLAIEQFFGHHIYSIAHVNNLSKPHPAVYLHAAKQLGVDPKECIAIEDSAAGIRSAQAAGMYCIGINTHNNYNQVKGANEVVNSYAEIDLDRLLGKMRK